MSDLKILNEYADKYKEAVERESGKSGFRLLPSDLKKYRIKYVLRNEQLLGAMALIKGEDSRSLKLVNEEGKLSILQKLGCGAENLIEPGCAFRTPGLSKKEYFWKIWIPTMMRCILTPKKTIFGTYKGSGIQNLYIQSGGTLLYESYHGVVVYLLRRRNILKLLVNIQLSIIKSRKTIRDKLKQSN